MDLCENLKAEGCDDDDESNDLCIRYVRGFCRAISTSYIDETNVLMTAIHNGNAKTVINLLDHGADVNKCTKNKLTPLMLCAQDGRTDFMRILLQHGARTEERNESGNTALSICSARGHKHAANLLLEYDANPNTQNNGGVSPLMFSAYNGHIEIVQYLLMANTIHLELKEKKRGDTALLLSAMRGHRDVVKTLLENDADVNATNSHNSTALNISAEYGYEGIVDDLISNGAVLDKYDNDGDTPLLSCTKKKQCFMLETLVDAGADVTHQNKKGQTVLLLCSEYGWSQYVKIILEAGRINCNKEDIDKATGRASGSCENHMDICFPGIEAKAENGNTALSIFAEKGDKYIVGLLLEYGADPNTQNKFGLSPLMLSANNGHTETVEYLLETTTINLELRESKRGDTALLMSARRGHKDIVRALLEKGADVNAADSHGSTALNLSAQYGHEGIVDVLIRNGAALDQHDNDGDTPLLSCAYAKQRTILETLVEAGADVTHVNEKGETALMICSKSGWRQDAKVILERGLDKNTQDDRDNFAICDKGVHTFSQHRVNPDAKQVENFTVPATVTEFKNVDFSGPKNFALQREVTNHYVSSGLNGRYSTLEDFQVCGELQAHSTRPVIYVFNNINDCNNFTLYGEQRIKYGSQGNYESEDDSESE